MKHFGFVRYYVFAFQCRCHNILDSKECRNDRLFCCYTLIKDTFLNPDIITHDQSLFFLMLDGMLGFVTYKYKSLIANFHFSNKVFFLNNNFYSHLLQLVGICVAIESTYRRLFLIFCTNNTKRLFFRVINLSSI